MYRHTRLDRLLHTLSEALHSVIVSHVLPQSTPVRPALKESEVPRKVVESPSQGVFKLDVVLRDVI